MTGSEAPATAGPRVRRWWGVGLGVAAVGWGANQFAPLLLLYRAELGLSAATVQATYGLYALGLVPGLLLGGPASDRLGRRRALVPALAVSALASLLLVAGGTGAGWLFGGRLVAGAASGVAFSAGTAWIKELSATGDGSAPDPGARRATVAMTAGFAGGPLAAGLLARYAPAPTIAAYVPHLLLIVVALPLAWRTRETRAPRGPAGHRPVRRAPRPGRTRLWTVVVPLAPWVFGASSIALAYLPALVRDRLGADALLFGAVVTALTMVAGIGVQPLARRLDGRGDASLIVTALGIVVAGLLAASLAAAVRDPLLVAAAAVVLGAAYGACYVCGLLEAQRIAGPDDLARVTGIYQTFAYLGFSAPFLLSVLEYAARPPALLAGTAGLAAFTLAWTARAPTMRR